MEASKAATENICPVEFGDNVGLSDIIDYLNNIDSNTNAVMTDQEMTANPTVTANSNQLGQQSQLSQSSSPQSRKNSQKPYIRILEEPAGKALRFRYECEGRSAGSIPGVNSTTENKTYPTIEIVGHKGDVTIVVSCVTKDPPYRPHPHNLVGKDGCKNGICTLQLSGEPLRAVFSNLGIQCVKKRDIKAALDVREKMQVDPFKTKFGHKDQPSSIDLNAVRLCFQAFLKNGSGWKPLTPVVSDPIFDKKAMSDLVICRLCSCSAKVSGGDEIILLCEKIAKDDIKVKFFETNNEGNVVWEDFAEFQQTDIHKQTAIAFKTPRYHNTDIVDKAKVFIQLIRPSDGVTSEALPFEYFADPDQIKRKRLKTNGSPMTILRRELQKHELQSNVAPFFRNDFNDISNSNGNGMWNIPNIPEIKTEPAMSPQMFNSHRSPHHLSPSPQPQSPMMNRNSTPSPCLMKALSASSQTQMCDMFAYNIGMNSPNSMATPSESSNPHQQVYYNGVSSVAGETDGLVCGAGMTAMNPFMRNDQNCDEAKYTNMMANNNNIVVNTNTTTLYEFAQTAEGSRNPFAAQILNNISGGSITPLWPTATYTSPTTVAATAANHVAINNNNSNFTNTLVAQHPLNIIAPDMQQLQNDIDMLTNTDDHDLEEGPTLSGLLAFVDGEQLLAINSDELKHSNLSLRT